MRNYFFMSVLWMGCHVATGQNYIPYYNLVNEAEYQLYLGKTDLAFGLYHKAFNLKKIRPKAKDLYVVGKIYLEKNDKKQALKYLRKVYAVPDGALAFWMTSDKVFFLNYIGEYEWRTLIDEARLKEAALHRSLVHWKDSSDHYRKEDQRLRKILADSIAPRFREGQKAYDEFQARMREHDYAVQQQFLSFIKKHGYPGLYMVGSDVAGSILMHIDCRLYPAYKSVLFDLLVAGKVEPFHYASMVDRVGCRCEGKSMYTNAGGCEIDWPTMLENREAIGLSKYFNGTGVHPIRERSLLKPRE